MIVGIPKEIMPGEARVAATPETVKKFVQDGMTVLVETGAGVKSLYYDEQYKEAGAELVSDAEHLFERADLILKVKEPLFNDNVGKHEVEMMHAGQYLVTFIHPASPVNHKMVKQLADAGVIGLTLDSIPRISRAQNMDALTSMSTCAGYKGIIMAADDLSIFMPQMFTAVGMLKPANVLVIGAGVGGLQALATAKRLGAVTYAMDIRPAANEQAKSLGAKIIETGVPEELAVGQGGYAQKLPEEWLLKEREVLSGVLKDMDIVFCSALIPGKVAPILITEKMVEAQKQMEVDTKSYEEAMAKLEEDKNYFEEYVSSGIDTNAFVAALQTRVEKLDTFLERTLTANMNQFADLSFLETSLETAMFIDYEPELDLNWTGIPTDNSVPADWSENIPHQV